MERAAAAAADRRSGSSIRAAMSPARRVGRHVLLFDQPAAAGLGQHRRVGLLVLVEGAGQRHHDRRPADHRELGAGRGARAADDQMACRHALRQVGEERRELRLDAGRSVGLAHAVDILRPALLHDAHLAAHALRQRRDRRRHRIGQEAGALAAADDEQAERIVGGARRIGGPGRLARRRPDRVAGLHHLALVTAADAGHAGGDGADARGEEAVGAAEHGVLLVDDGRHPGPGRRQHRRHGRVAAEADRGVGIEAPHQSPRLDDSRARA